MAFIDFTTKGPTHTRSKVLSTCEGTDGTYLAYKRTLTNNATIVLTLIQAKRILQRRKIRLVEKGLWRFPGINHLDE